MVWLRVAGPDDVDTERTTERITLDVYSDDDDFVQKYAKYRNALNEVQQKKFKKRWSRKNMHESLLEAQVVALRKQMAQMFADVGPFPDAEDADAMLAYAKRVVAWSKKNNKPE